jgi:hypothetical protein
LFFILFAGEQFSAILANHNHQRILEHCDAPAARDWQKPWHNMRMLKARQYRRD